MLTMLNKRCLRYVNLSKEWEIIAMETDKDHIHFLVEYDATDRVCDIVKVVKQETTYYLWQTKGFNL